MAPVVYLLGFAGVALLLVELAKPGAATAAAAGLTTAAGGGGVPGSSGLRALFPKGGYSLSRTDAGVDFGLQAGKPLGAIGPGRIAAVEHYEGFGTTIFQELDTPIAGYKYVYYALETGADQPLPAGSRVQAGEPIANGTGGGMEIGLSTGPNVQGINQTHIAAGDRTRVGEIFARALGLSPGAPNTPAKAAG